MSSSSRWSGSSTPDISSEWLGGGGGRDREEGEEESEGRGQEGEEGTGGGCLQAQDRAGAAHQISQVSSWGGGGGGREREEGVGRGMRRGKEEAWREKTGLEEDIFKLKIE